MGERTICTDCLNSRYCSWFTEHRPVVGWAAKQVGDGYIVRACPLFQFKSQKLRQKAMERSMQESKKPAQLPKWVVCDVSARSDGFMGHYDRLEGVSRVTGIDPDEIAYRLVEDGFQEPNGNYFRVQIGEWVIKRLVITS